MQKYLISNHLLNTTSQLKSLLHNAGTAADAVGTGAAIGAATGITGPSATASAVASGASGVPSAT